MTGVILGSLMAEMVWESGEGSKTFYSSNPWQFQQNNQVNFQQDAPANQPEAVAAVQRNDVVTSNIANDSIIGMENQTSTVDTWLEYRECIPEPKSD